MGGCSVDRQTPSIGLLRGVAPSVPRGHATCGGLCSAAGRLRPQRETSSARAGCSRCMRSRADNQAVPYGLSRAERAVTVQVAVSSSSGRAGTHCSANGTAVVRPPPPTWPLTSPPCASRSPRSPASPTNPANAFPPRSSASSPSRVVSAALAPPAPGPPPSSAGHPPTPCPKSPPPTRRPGWRGSISPPSGPPQPTT